jgi:hypothetical protein
VATQAQKTVVPAFRSERSVARYSLAARSLPKAERSIPSVGPWWTMVLGVPLFLRTLLRLVFFCAHWHKGPPITLRETIPSNLSGCLSVDGRETYITCLDCGKKFAYNHKTRRLVDYWGVRDAEALAGVRRRLDGFFLGVRGLAARINRLNMRVPTGELGKSVHRIASLTKGQWIKFTLVDCRYMPGPSIKPKPNPNPIPGVNGDDAGLTVYAERLAVYAKHGGASGIKRKSLWHWFLEMLVGEWRLILRDFGVSNGVRRRD